MSEPCATCDAIGPDRNDTVQAMRDLHRAFHDCYRTLVTVLEPFAAAVRKQRERERLVTKDAFVLVNESVAASLRGER